MELPNPNNTSLRWIKGSVLVWVGGASALSSDKQLQHSNDLISSSRTINNPRHEVVLQGWWHLEQKNKEGRFFGKMEEMFSFSVAHKTTRSARSVIDGVHGKNGSSK